MTEFVIAVSFFTFVTTPPFWIAPCGQFVWLKRDYHFRATEGNPGEAGISLLLHCKTVNLKILPLQKKVKISQWPHSKQFTVNEQCIILVLK